jgi:hypothetical protein
MIAAAATITHSAAAAAAATTTTTSHPIDKSTWIVMMMYDHLIAVHSVSSTLRWFSSLSLRKFAYDFGE